MRFIIQRVGRSTPAWRSAVLLAALGLTTACRQDDALPTGPRVAPPSGPLVAIEGANVTDLPFAGVAINDAGQVAGTQNPGEGAGEPPPRAMLYTPGVGVQDLGTLGGTKSAAYALNEQGQVVGYSTTATGARHAFLWTPGAGMRDLGVLAEGLGSIARGINDRGAVVGQSTLPYPATARNPETHAFLWTPAGGMQDLGALGGELTSSVAYDINNAGQVVGRSYSADRIIPPDPGSDAEYFSRAFLWAPGQGMKDLGALASGYAVAYAINDAGLIVGKSWVSTVLSEEYGYSGRPVLWEPGQAIRDLGGLRDGAHNSAAYGINEAGLVVGSSDLGRIPDGAPVQAFLWSAADGMESLFPTTGLTTAQDINNHQQVVGDTRIATLHVVPGNDHPAASTRGSGFYSVPGQGNRKAHFTFRADFPSGGFVPNGSVRLWIPNGDKNFEGSTIQMLVVSGNRAEFWGTGTLNGTPARFRITAVDGNAHHDGLGDAIRVELWNASGTTLLYDSQPGATQDAPVTTPVDGGNIQVRRG